MNNTLRKKLTSTIVMLVMILTIITPMGAFAADVKTFDLIEITDYHGALEDSSVPALPVAGVLAKDIKDIKAANPDRTLVMGGGDLYQGTGMSNILFGVPVQKAMSAIGMEVTALGNHEFDWGLDKVTDTTMKDAKYSIICANLYDKKTNTRKFSPYKIITRDGVKIGIIGAITTETPSIVLPAFVADYTFTDPAVEINKLVPEVKAAGVDVIVALIHEGTNADTKTGPVYGIANKLTGVDAVFGGHSHTIAAMKVPNGVPVYVGNSAGKGFIDAKVTIGADGKPSFVCDSSSYVAINTNTPGGYKAANPKTDAEVMAIVADAKAQVGPVLDAKIGKTNTKLTKDQTVPFTDSILGNWNADVIRAKVQADVAFQNNGGIRINIDPGDITVGTIYTLMPFDNVICTATMTKAQIKYIMEQAVADNGKGIQLSGIRVTYDMSRKSMDRVTSIVRSNGAPISDTEMLKVATNDFLMTGGDGFTGFVDAGGAVKGVPVNNTQILVRDALIDDVKAHNGITATVDGRLKNAAYQINLVATSDLHGSLMPFDYSSMKAADLGLAKVSTYVNWLRTSNPGKVLLVDNGDTIQGTPMAYYYDKLDTTSEYPMMKAMGAMHYDTWTLGNHEFNFGLPTLKRIIKDAAMENIKVLSANTYYDKTNVNFVKPYVLKRITVGGKPVVIGILGLTTKTIPNWEDKDHYTGLKFRDLVEQAKKWVPIMKESGADIVIATIHSGIASAADTIPENQVDAVAKSVSGIDAIVAGHTHTAIAEMDFKNPSGKTVLVTEPKNTDKIFSEIDMSFDSTGKFTGITSRNITLDANVPADPAILAIGQPYQDQTMNYVNTSIGAATDEFSGVDQTIKPTALMDLINTVQMKAAGTQLSIAAPLSATADIPKGDIKIKDLMGVYVYENFLYGIKMNGKQIKSWLEASNKYYKQVTKSDDPIVKDPVLNTPDYNLDFLYGATYDVDLTQPVGSRIKNLKYDGKLIGDTDEFTVAINNYRFNGGGGFLAAAGIKNGDQSIVVYDSAKALGDDGQVRNLMINYIKQVKTISPVVANNWKLYTTTVEQQK